MQFLTLVLVPIECDDIVEAATHLMEPFDVARTVAHKEYVPQDELDYMVEVYGPFGLKADDVDALIAELEDDSGFVCGHDDGGIWYMTTDNPHAKWDGWRIDSVQRDTWPTTADLPEGLYPSAVITPDGVWHDIDVLHGTSDEGFAALRASAAVLLSQYPSHLAVALHCHR